MINLLYKKNLKIYILYKQIGTDLPIYFCTTKEAQSPLIALSMASIRSEHIIPERETNIHFNDEKHVFI